MTDQIKITVDTNVLQGLAMAAAKKDVRYYLNGVLIEYDADSGTVHLVGTDGHMMFAYKQPDSYLLKAPENTGPTGLYQAIIPHDLLTGLSKSTKAQTRHAEITVENNGWATVRDIKKGTLTSAQVIAGQYPTWRRVVPQSGRELDNSWIPFDLTLVGQCGKIAALLNGHAGLTRSSRMAPGDQSGDSALILPSVDKPWIGVLMPMNIRDRDADENINPQNKVKSVI